MWEISHTQEAWENAEMRLSLKKYRKLMIDALVADDEALLEEEGDLPDDFDSDRFYRQALAKYRKFDHSYLVEEVMDRMQDHRCCTDGGFEFYLDRSGWYSISVDDLTDQERRHLPDWAAY